MNAVATLIESWVVRRPAECAVRTAATGAVLSYQQLWDRSGRLAAQLQAVGVQRGEFVAVAMPRSVGLVVALLGIMRSGAAYLPLDPHAPADRTAMMLTDAEVRVVLEADDDAPSTTGLSLPKQLRRIPVPTTGPLPGDGEPELVPGSADDPAYLAYTSGSTGRPKGVVVPHRAVAALVDSPNFCPISPGDRVASSSNPAFDALTFEIWSTLIAGATVVVLPTVTDLPLERWVELVRTERITTMFLTTALFHMVAGEQPGAFHTIDNLLVGGEQLDLAAARLVLATAPPRRLVNVYGPTETTTFATWFECTAASLADRERAPIGFALPNTRLLVLDDTLQPAAPGETGELCIAGPGVALGYLRRPELTGRAFIPEPGRPTATMYRTGDLVRELPDGALETLGRRDRQVKLRGFRIELDEIERAAVDTGLATAAFVDKLGEGASATLVGFVLPTASAAATSDLSEILATALARRLPAYMIPARWTVLHTLPVGSTGKVDRAALLAQATAVNPPLAVTSGSKSPTVVGLRRIWRDVLGLNHIQDSDNFFELGGNSILAIQLVFRARSQLNLELEPADVLRSRSLTALAARARPCAAATLNTAADQIHRYAMAGPAPLSPAQERIWFLQQLFPDSTEYHVPVVVRLRGRLDERSLRRALAAIVERHAILRSLIVKTTGGEPELITKPSGPVDFSVHDLRPHTRAAGDPTGDPADSPAVHQLLRTVTGTPFDLAAAPAWRVDLLQLGSRDQLLAFTFHHLIFDGWSVGVLLRELDLCYVAFAANEIPVLSPLPLQFSDFARWQREPARDAARATDLAFWCDRLQGVAPLELPTEQADVVRAQRCGPGRGVPFALPAALSHNVLRLSQQQGTTPFATLFTAFQVLLSRLSGQSDVAVAVPLAGRSRAETVDSIGFFVNTQVVRSDLAGNPAFADVLAATQDRLIEALEHQEAPFERIVEQLRPERDLHRNPLTQVIFGARDPLPTGTEHGLRLERHEWGQGSAGFDLAVEIEASAAGICGRLDFPPGQFDDATVRRLLEGYESILAAAADRPQTRIEQLPLADHETLRAVLADGTGAVAAVADQLLHELLSERAAGWPDAVALEYEGGRLSYADLESRAATVAAGLSADGVGAGDIVAVMLPRGPELVAAILGVLRVGAAYLPINPGQPRGRLELLLADVKAVVALTDSALAPRLDGLAFRVLRMDQLSSTARSRTVVQRRDGLSSGEQLAYVIFTSGSTGRPKPVAVPHRALVNHAMAVVDLFGLGPDDRVLQFASAGFDVFAEEVFPTLLAGGRVVFPPVATQPVPSVAEFEALVRSAAISVVNLPASFWAQWTTELLAGHRQPGSSLRLVVTGSEPVDGRLLGRWQQHTGVPVANVYGVSEATVSTLAMMRALPTAQGTVPVGLPIANTQAFVLDAAMGPLPRGVQGELCLGGFGVAQGYLGRPELTAERFVPDPYGPPGSRLYRTGDLARWLSTGSLELNGRADGQLKIRGHRIEPGEIESRLAEHPDIVQAAVRAHTDAAGSLSLVAYLVCAGAPPALAELRRFLRERLPESMVPGVFVPLDELPINVNGKIDRTALPAPDARQLNGNNIYRAPASVTERVLAEIWSELLGRSPVGADDDFFELGGHSLLATQVVSRLRERLARELPLRAIFENPTIAALARALDDVPVDSQPTGPVLRRASRSGYRLAAVDLDRHVPIPDTSLSGATSHVA